MGLVFLWFSYFLNGIQAIAILVCLGGVLSPEMPNGANFKIGFIDQEGATEANAVRAGAYAEAAKIQSENGDVINLDFKLTTPQNLKQTIESMTSDQAVALSAAFSISILTTQFNTVPLVMYGDRGPNPSRYTAVVGVKDEECGKQLMTAIAEMIKSPKRVEILGEEESDPAMKKRLAGAKSQAETYPDIRIIGLDYCGFLPDPIRVYNVIENIWIRSRPFEGWLSLFNLPQLNWSAIPWQPREIVYGSVAASGVDAAFLQLREGRIQALSVYDFYEWGRQCLRILYNQIAKGEKPATNVIEVNPVLVTNRNVEEIKDKWKLP